MVIFVTFLADPARPLQSAVRSFLTTSTLSERSRTCRPYRPDRIELCGARYDKYVRGLAVDPTYEVSPKTKKPETP